MERDRRACLITEAFARGLIDYSKYDITSSNVVRVENVIINQIEKEAYDKLLTLRYFNHALKQTILTPGEKGLDFHKAQVEEVGTVYNHIGNLLLPWRDWNIEQINSKSSKLKEADNLQARWEKAFGSLQDPKVKAQLQKLEEANKSLNEPVF